MINRHSRQNMRRRIRAHKRQFSDIGGNANKQLDRHIFRRWHNLKDARRFIVVWVLLIVVLIMGIVVQTRVLGKYYLEPTAISGGVVSEGMVGTFSNANPIFASSTIDSSVSRLVFAGLLTYDEKNKLTGDLAASWETDSKGLVYTVRLKPNLTWQDGAPLTADDVVFTFKTIQNPDAKSPLQSSWTNIKIDKVSNSVVQFTLPNAYSPFLYSLTTGIVPKHLLKDIPIDQLRSAAFNNVHPIGAGPFKWQSITSTGEKKKQDQSQTIQLVGFNDFNKGIPKLEGITISTYPNDQDLLAALKTRKIMDAVGVSYSQGANLKGDTLMAYPETASTMLFLKNSSPILTDANVRRAIVSGTNVPELIKALDHPAIPVNEPLLKTQIGYDAKLSQRNFNQEEAKKLLDNAGWTLPAGKTIREKEGKQLTLKLVSENNPEYSMLTTALQKQWKQIGVKAEVSLQPPESIAQSYILAHNYDVLLYGINMGPDPDAYSYWHSSQADVRSQGRLNLSEYKSSVADSALESGRSRLDTKLRAIKYKAFLEAWRSDAPAIGIYQPNYYVLTNQQTYGMVEKTINSAADRYNNAADWMINTERTVKK